MGWRLIAVTKTSDFSPASSNDMFNIHTTKDCWLRLKFERHMTKTYNEMHSKDKYSHLSSIIWWLGSNGGVFVYELYGCGFEINYSYINFRFGSCFEQQDGQHWDN